MKSNEKSGSTRATLGKLMHFVKPNALWAVVRILGAVVSVAVDMLLVYVMLNSVDASLAGKREELIRILFMLLLMIILGMVFSFINKYSSGRLSAYTSRDIRKKAVGHMEKLPMSYMESNHSGELISRLTNDITSVQNFLENDFANLIFEPLRFLAAFTYMLFINWKLLLFSVIILPVTVILAGIISKPIGKYTEQLQQHMAKVNAVAQDCIGGIHMLKAFNLKDVLFKKYNDAVDNALEYSLAVEKRRAMTTPVNILMNSMPFGLCILYGGYLAVKGQITTGGLLAFVQMMNYMVSPASTMPNLINSLRGAMGAAAHLFEIFGQRPERTGGGTFVADPSAPAVEFRDVSFSYDGENGILDKMSFKVGGGKSVALVGASGSGKSTIFKLLCGFYKLQEGCIKLLGNELEKWDISAARSKISLVTQDTYLFPTTIAENISYGRPGASRDEIVQAAKTANAHEFITALPDGYNTIAGERGARLSGGQKQRIAIARAVLKDAPILLLDEPTSALDTESEALVQETLECFMKGRTTLIIAHRLSTIKNVDEVMVLDEGCIVELGPHEQLMDKGGLYKQLYLKQFVSEGYDQASVEREGA